MRLLTFVGVENTPYGKFSMGKSQYLEYFKKQRIFSLLYRTKKVVTLMQRLSALTEAVSRTFCFYLALLTVVLIYFNKYTLIILENWLIR